LTRSCSCLNWTGGKFLSPNDWANQRIKAWIVLDPTLEVTSPYYFVVDRAHLFRPHSARGVVFVRESHVTDFRTVIMIKKFKDLLLRACFTC